MEKLLDIGPAIDRFSKTIEKIAAELRLVRDAQVEGMIQGGLVVGVVLILAYLFLTRAKS